MKKNQLLKHEMLSMLRRMDGLQRKFEEKMNGDVVVYSVFLSIMNSGGVLFILYFTMIDMYLTFHKKMI